MSTFKDYTTDQRKAMAKKGEALPDGSFPIADKQDLENAIQSVGRASDPAASKAHIPPVSVSQVSVEGNSFSGHLGST